MSHQLRLSSLLSALALVGLALFARAGELGGSTGNVPVGSTGLLVQIVSSEK